MLELKPSKWANSLIKCARRKKERKKEENWRSILYNYSCVSTLQWSNFFVRYTDTYKYNSFFLSLILHGGCFSLDLANAYFLHFLSLGDKCVIIIATEISVSPYDGALERRQHFQWLKCLLYQHPDKLRKVTASWSVKSTLELEPVHVQDNVNDRHVTRTRLFSGDANTHFQLAVVAVTVVSRHRSDFKFDGYDAPHFQFKVIAVIVVSRHRPDIDFKFDGYDAPHFQFTVVAVIVVSRHRSDSDFKFDGYDAPHFQFKVIAVTVVSRHRPDIDFKFDGYDAPHFQFTVVAVIVVSRHRSDSDLSLMAMTLHISSSK